MASAGKLKIIILEAKLTHDTEMMGKMDPFVIVETRMQRYRTNTQEDAGKTPAWADEVLEVDVKYIGDDIHFVVMDEEMMSDDLVGECTAKLSAFIGTGGEMDDWWEINYKGKSAGHLHIRSQYEETGETLKDLPAVEDTPPPQLVMANGQVAQKQVVFEQPYYQNP